MSYFCCFFYLYIFLLVNVSVCMWHVQRVASCDGRMPSRQPSDQLLCRPILKVVLWQEINSLSLFLLLLLQNCHTAGPWCDMIWHMLSWFEVNRWTKQDNLQRRWILRDTLEWWYRWKCDYMTSSLLSTWSVPVLYYCVSMHRRMWHFKNRRR